MQQLEKPKQGYKFVKSLFGKIEEIPEDWKIEQLGKFVKIFSGDYFPYDDFIEDGVRVLKIDNVMYGNIDWKNKTFLPKSYLQNDKFIVLQKDDIVLALNRPVTNNRVKVAKLTVTDIPSILYQRVGKFQFHEYKINRDFFYSYLSSIFFQKLISKILIGSDQPYVKTTELLKQKFTLPSDEKEQQKIASILSNVDSLIQQTQQEIEQTQRLKKGFMQRLLTKGIGHTRFKETKVGEIPEEWSIFKANEICNEIVVGIVIKPASLYSKDGVPCLRSFNIKEEKIYDKDIVKISHKANEINSKSKLQEGDVLIVRTGYPGTACVVPQEYVGGNCIDLVIARPKESLRSKFLSIFINSSVGKDQVLKTQGGLAQQHFNVSEMKNMLIPLPSLQEQDKITSILSNVDSQIQKHQEYKSKLENLKKGLMQKLLTGQIRVKV
ncbi:MAG: restriction endonuclease subunit S [Nitrosotalea sp.]